MARSAEYRASLRQLGAFMVKNAGDTEIVSADQATENIEKIRQEKPDEPAIVICLPADVPTAFTDNVKTVCTKCTLPIVHRPSMPANAIKVCIHCAVAYLNAGTKTYVIEN